MAKTPQILYVGLQKTGSEFLRSYFEYHPDIYWSYGPAEQFRSQDYHAQKYLSAFNRECNKAAHIDVWEGLFMGYITPDGNWSRELIDPRRSFSDKFKFDLELILDRIATTLPNVKILLTIRNQVSWIRSNYCHYMLGMPDGYRNLFQFLNTLEGKAVIQVANYDRIISSLYTRFGRNNVLVLPLEKIASDEHNSLKEICDFVDLEFIPFKGIRNHNKGLRNSFISSAQFLDSCGFGYSSGKHAVALTYLLEALMPSYFWSDTISKEVEYLIKIHYSETNRKSSILTGIDLNSFGYTC
jgi:hypothetical protein